MAVNDFSTNSLIPAEIAASSGVLPGFTTTEEAPRDNAGRSKWTDRLTEAQKERIIMECKDAKTQKDVKKIIEEKVPYGEMGNFLDEVRDSVL